MAEKLRIGEEFALDSTREEALSELCFGEDEAAEEDLTELLTLNFGELVNTELDNFGLADSDDNSE